MANNKNVEDQVVDHQSSSSSSDSSEDRRRDPYQYCNTPLEGALISSRPTRERQEEDDPKYEPVAEVKYSCPSCSCLIRYTELRLYGCSIYRMSNKNRQCTPDGDVGHRVPMKSKQTMSTRGRMRGWIMEGFPMTFGMSLWNKNNAEAKALSVQMVEKALENAKNPHHLGSGGYAPKIPKWKKEKEELIEEQPHTNEAEDDDWVNGLLAQEALEFDISPPSSPLQPISSSPKRSEHAPSTSKPADVGERTCVPRTIETYQKLPSAMVDKFLLGAMKNSSACKASASTSNVEKSPERSSDFLLQLPEIRTTNASLTKDDIDDICTDMCRFIHREICHERGLYYSDESELAEDKYR
ncbi:hypothetical protein C2845_PM04G14260 [Panicum miliaceum]|uniref:Uncharacterized protein n=1 Tax=Panicum miliaceum TaxID=4540 RepID=A0A3L6QSK3_PANMI|nr:hypothetical protein C2845_PM04G14260 [Panicum miliaceum]